jgi:hypothetical protein
VGEGDIQLARVVLVEKSFIFGTVAAGRAFQSAANTRRNRKSGEVGEIKV